jgi:diguanylate cyclase (GGDEF)-like protein
MLKNIKITTKLPMIMISFALISSITTGLIAFLNASQALEDTAKKQLFGLMESRRSALTGYFDTIDKDLVFHGKNPLVIAALRSLTEAYEILPKHQDGYLRTLYVDKNPYSREQRDAFLQAKDGSTYSQLHRYYHPIFRNLTASRSFHDLLLISARGEIIYSVNKEPDFATNLFTGPWKATKLAQVFQKISQDPRSSGNVFSDFTKYAPSDNEAASFIGSAVFDPQGVYLGSIVFQMPIASVNKVMQVTAGMAQTGETYVVGEDFLMRSDSRFFKGTSILQTKVNTASVRLALAGESGVHIAQDYRNKQVFSAFTPIDFLNVRWALIAEIDESEIMQPVFAMSRFLLISGVIIAAVIFLAGLILAFDISSPVITMSKAMTRLANNDLDINISVSDRKDEVGAMAKALQFFKGNLLERDKLQKELSYITDHDTLTGLHSRSYVIAKLEAQLIIAKAQSSQLIVMFIDLDNFKTINDSLGHATGDQLLVEVAERLTKCVRNNDLVARFGGDEFVILLPNVSNIEDGYYIAAKIRQTMDSTFLSIGNAKFAASTGIALYPKHGTSATELLNEADKSMYIDKSKDKAKEKQKANFTPDIPQSKQQTLN